MPPWGKMGPAEMRCRERARLGPYNGGNQLPVQGTGDQGLFNGRKTHTAQPPQGVRDPCAVTPMGQNRTWRNTLKGRGVTQSPQRSQPVACTSNCWLCECSLHVGTYRIRRAITSAMETTPDTTDPNPTRRDAKRARRNHGEWEQAQGRQTQTRNQTTRTPKGQQQQNKQGHPH